MTPFCIAFILNFFQQELTMIKQLAYIFLSLLKASVIADTLTINIANTGVNKGNVLIGVYDNKKDFPDGEALQVKNIVSQNKTVKATFNIQDGIYAVAVFQDSNNNEELDKNFFGIPNEKYGFSGNPMFGKPDFKDAEFILKGTKTISIELK